MTHTRISCRTAFISINIFLTLCLHLPLHAQVIIKDTVVISPGQIMDPQREPLLPVTDIFFITPDSGALAIMPSFAYKVRNPLPLDAYLAIRLSDTTYTPQILPYLPYQRSDSAQLQDSCRFFEATEYRYCATLPCQSFAQTAFDTFYTRWVQTGDTVRFSFHAEYNSPTTLIQNPAPNRWRVHLWTQFCSSYFPEQCYLSFFFADTLVKFITPDTSVYPTYQGRNNTPATRNYVDLELRVEFADSPIPNYWVRVDTPVVVDSGGHSHSYTSPRRPVGRFIHPIESTTDTTDTLLAQTDSTGKVRFRYVASQFGGRERIRARLVSDTTKLDTLSLMTRVPGLILFPAGTNYSKTGGTCAHHGPSDSIPLSCTTPDNNHYFASQDAIDSLIFSANEFVRAKWNTTGVMRLNDISLPRGGLFDLDTNWSASKGHSLHRIGRSVDIENISWETVDTVSPYTGDDTLFTIPKVKWVRDFARFMEVQMRNWHFVDEGQTRSGVFRRTRKFPHFEWTGN